MKLTNFLELREGEVQLRRIPLPRTPVNKGKKKGRGYLQPSASSSCVLSVRRGAGAALEHSHATKSRGRLGTPALFGPTLKDVGLTYDAELALRTGNNHLGPEGLGLRNSRADVELPAESHPAIDLVRTVVARVRVGVLIVGRSEGRV